MAFSSEQHYQLVVKNITDFLNDPRALTNSETFMKNLDEKNPRRPTERGDPTERWFRKDGNLATLNFPALMNRKGRFDRTGPYFNATNNTGETKLDHRALKNLKAIFELQPLTNDDYWSYMYPDGAVRSSQQALAAILCVQSDFDKKRGSLPESKQTRVVRTYTNEDRYVIMLTSESLLFEEQETIHISCTTASQLASEMSLSPSKMKKLLSASSPEPTDNRLRLRDLPDTEQLFKQFPDCSTNLVRAPPLFNSRQELIEPTRYGSELPQESLVIVEACLCAWEIKKSSVIERRVIHLRPIRIQLVPFEDQQLKPAKPVIEEDGERRQGKRKSTKPTPSAGTSRAASTRSAGKKRKEQGQDELASTKKQRWYDPEQSPTSSPSSSMLRDENEDAIPLDEETGSDLIDVD